MFTPLKFILSKSDRMLRAEKYDSSLDSMNGFEGEEMERETIEGKENEMERKKGRNKKLGNELERGRKTR